MLKSYEAIYDNGQVTWLSDQPNLTTARLIITVIEEPLAIAHAQRLHTDDAEPWPPSVGTQVYKLVAHLIASPTPATSP
jgi:hypothetical protein